MISNGLGERLLKFLFASVKNIYICPSEENIILVRVVISMVSMNHIPVEIQFFLLHCL